MVQFNYKSDFKKIKILARAYKFLSTSRSCTPQESFSSQGIIFAFVLNADAWLLEIRTWQTVQADSWASSGETNLKLLYA
jgi:hypothetical protein